MYVEERRTTPPEKFNAHVQYRCKISVKGYGKTRTLLTQGTAAVDWRHTQRTPQRFQQETGFVREHLLSY